MNGDWDGLYRLGSFARHCISRMSRIGFACSSNRSAPREAFQATLSQAMRPSAAVGRCRRLIQAQLLSQSTAKRSRLQRRNKAATAVATKPLQRLQQKTTAVATKPLQRLQQPLRRLQKPLQLQLVTAALHVPPSVAGAARRRPALGEPSRTGLHHCKDYKQSATVATGANDAVGARAASR